MKKLNVEKMEMIEGGDCFKQGFDYLNSLQEWSEDPSDWNYIKMSFHLAEMINCISQ